MIYRQKIVSEKWLSSDCQCLAATVLYTIPEGVFITGLDGRVMDANPAMLAMLGVELAEVYGRPPNQWLPDAHNDAFYRAFGEGLDEGGWNGDVLYRHNAGGLAPARLTLKKVLGGLKGAAAALVGVVSSVCAGASAGGEYRCFSLQGPLPRLASRQAFIENCEHTMNRVQNLQGCLAVLLFNLDKFNDINDTLGHAAGDQVLETVAGQLRVHFGSSAALAYMGADEFAVIIESAAGDEEVKAIALAAVKALDVPHFVRQQEVYVSLSVGVGFFPRDAVNAEDLVDRARTALAHAKKAGHGACRIYRDEMADGARARIELEGALRHAIDHDMGLAVHYQPQIDLQTGMLVGVESLCRWTHPLLGPISPERFIGVAERSDLIEALGDWVLRETCRQMAAWRVDGVFVGTVAVNLSARQFQVADLAERIEAQIRAFDLSPDLFEFELTETAIAPDQENVISTLKRLRALGCHVAIDDFGTGYSTLHYLQHYPADTLKIDREFMTGLPEEGANAALAKTIIALADNFGLTSLAEGIETPAQRRFLASIGCSRGQGYLFGRPMSAEQLVEWSNDYCTHRPMFAQEGEYDAERADIATVFDRQ